MNRQQIVETLQHGIVEVNFTKKDGTERKMICTLMEEHLPRVPRFNKEDAPRTRTEDVIAVYDLEKMAWRSFHWTSVNSMADAQHPE